MAKKIIISSERKSKDLTSISKTLMPLAKQLLGTRGFMETDLLTNWKHIIGEELARYSLPQKLTFRKDERTDGCLTIAVLSGAFAMEIRQNEPRILDKINTYFGYKAVSKLKIIQNTNPEYFLISKKNIDNVKKNLVTEAEESYITELIKDVSNPELKETLKNLGIAVFNRRKK
ncbi:MAG: DUF721 domain-containing protein [Alphaproteobacteria bacterium]|nr:DUF721 domain-containing protein [Alphaproteobacteria bacterium]